MSASVVGESATKKYKVVSKDNKEFFVSESFFEQNDVLKDLFSYNNTEPVPCKEVNGKILKLIITFCEYFASDPPYNPDDRTSLKNDARVKRFMKALTSSQITELLIAADYVHNQRLIDAGLIYILQKVSNLEVKEIRTALNLPDDLSPEEKRVFKKEPRPRY